MGLIDKEKLIESIKVIAPYNWNDTEREAAECSLYDAIMEIIEAAAPVDEWTELPEDSKFHIIPKFNTLVDVVKTNGMFDLASCREGIDGKLHWNSIYHLEEIEVKAWRQISYKSREENKNE